MSFLVQCRLAWFHTAIYLSYARSILPLCPTWSHHIFFYPILWRHQKISSQLPTTLTTDLLQCCILLVVMSSNTDEADEVCASCGITGGNDVKLLLCTACKLVKYCSVDCQKNHRPQHKKACKKRAAEIRDARLFTQPD